MTMTSPDTAPDLVAALARLADPSSLRSAPDWLIENMARGQAHLRVYGAVQGFPTTSGDLVSAILKEAETRRLPLERMSSARVGACVFYSRIGDLTLNDEQLEAVIGDLVAWVYALSRPDLQVVADLQETTTAAYWLRYIAVSTLAARWAH